MCGNDESISQNKGDAQKFFTQRSLITEVYNKLHLALNVKAIKGSSNQKIRDELFSR